MTFEASRKKQTLVLQPRGKPLYEEKSSFGLKMLQSMGWQKGNGLGKNQQGNIDFIQVRYKNNDFGLGFDGLKDNQWTETESNFNSLLKQLNSNQPSSNSNSDQEETTKKKSTRSLEELSKQSRARVHYKKFTRGKDVHKYSEKDLANIFGKKSLTDVDSKKEEETKPEEVVEDKPDSYQSDLIINTGLSIADYFKQKKKRKEEEVVESEEPPKKKSKRNKIDQLIDLQDLPVEKNSKETEVTNSECNESEMPQEIVENVRRKKKKEKIVEEPVVNEEIPQEEPSKKKKKEKLVEEPIEEVQQEEPTKKKKKKSKNCIESEPVVEEMTELVNEIKSSKKSKSKQKAVEQHSEESNEPVKKKKKSKESNEAVITPTQSTQNDGKKSINADDTPKGANAVYTNDVVQIPQHVASKISMVDINFFSNSNIGEIVGYGMTENVELKVVQTKIGDKAATTSTDKYALYNMDKMQTKRVNPRKIKTKLKKTKKSIQVI